MVADRGGKKFVPSRRGSGLPDLFLLHDDPPLMIIAEVKGPKGKLSDRQREFLQLAREVAEYAAHIQLHRPIGVYAWTPADEPIIERVLRSKAVT